MEHRITRDYLFTIPAKCEVLEIGTDKKLETIEMDVALYVRAQTTNEAQKRVAAMLTSDPSAGVDAMVLRRVVPKPIPSLDAPPTDEELNELNRPLEGEHGR